MVEIVPIGTAIRLIKLIVVNVVPVGAELNL